MQREQLPLQVDEPDQWRGKARGKAMQLPHGGLPEVIPSSLRDQIQQEIAEQGEGGPLYLQFVAQPLLEQMAYTGEASDPLKEDHHEILPGLVYKYVAKYDEKGNLVRHGRVLFTATFTCAAYCRYCTRGREVGHRPPLTDQQIEDALEFIRTEPGLNEVILSGGDPLTLPPERLKYILGELGKMQESGKLDIVRIGTRLPIHNPKAFKEYHFEAIAQLRNPNIMLHVNHAKELTTDAISVLNRLRRECLANIFSQTVLLVGVNYFEDEAGNPIPDVLKELFQMIAKLGFHPYYVFQGDPVYWAGHTIAPIKKAKRMWGIIRKDLSGIVARARFVIDAPEKEGLTGFGKIPAPEGEMDDEGYVDFEGNWFPLE